MTKLEELNTEKKELTELLEELAVKLTEIEGDLMEAKLDYQRDGIISPKNWYKPIKVAQTELQIQYDKAKRRLGEVNTELSNKTLKIYKDFYLAAKESIQEQEFNAILEKIK